MQATETQSAVRERPILFSAPMVRAILDGRKTQTRRVITQGEHAQDADAWAFDAERGLWESGIAADYGRHGHGEWVRCPYGQPVDRLWVRETWRSIEHPETAQDGIEYRADHGFKSIEDTQAAADLWVDAHDNGKHGGNWRPSIFMKRWASRITLEVTGVRVERVKDISEEDAAAEGATPAICGIEERMGEVINVRSHRTGFVHLWQSINGDREGCSWEANPWVWVVEFRVINPTPKAEEK
jgi:hypothetical protein